MIKDVKKQMDYLNYIKVGGKCYFYIHTVLFEKNILKMEDLIIYQD